MNKSFIAPFAPTEIPSVQLNISEWRDHSPKVIYNRATQSEIDGWDFQLCAWEMFPAICSNVFYFSFLSPATYVSQQGRRKWRNVFPVYLRFYVQLQDLLTQFNYETFPKQHKRSINVTIEGVFSSYLLRNHSPQCNVNLHNSTWLAKKKKKDYCQNLTLDNCSDKTSTLACPDIPQLHRSTNVTDPHKCSQQPPNLDASVLTIPPEKPLFIPFL